MIKITLTIEETIQEMNSLVVAEADDPSAREHEVAHAACLALRKVITDHHMSMTKEPGLVNETSSIEIDYDKDDHHNRGKGTG